MERYENQKLGIVFVKNESGSYVLEGVYDFDTAEKQKILERSEVISISDKKLSGMLKGRDTSFLVMDAEDKKHLSFVIDRKLFQSIMDEANKQGHIEDNTEKTLMDALNQITSNLDSFEVKKGGSVLSCVMHFKETAQDAYEEDQNSTKEKPVVDLSKINPAEIKRRIKEKVIGQDRAVDMIVNLIYTNQKIVEYGNDDLMRSLATALIDGPTGTGKTLISQEVAKELSLPVAELAITEFSSAGYKGDDLVKTICTTLLQKAEELGGGIELAERGIVVLDEFDKLASNINGLEMKRSVQQDLLPVLGRSGTHTVEYKGKTYTFDFSKLTFLCMGAFTDLRKRKIAESKDGTYTITDTDYMNEGLSDELVGRFSVLGATRDFGKEDYIKILTTSKISPLLCLKKAAKEIFHKELIYDDSFVDKLADMASHGNTGARRLNTIVEGMKLVISDQLNDPNITQIELDFDILEKSLEVEKRTAPRNMDDKIEKLEKKAPIDEIKEEFDLDEDPIEGDKDIQDGQGNNYFYGRKAA